MTKSKSAIAAAKKAKIATEKAAAAIRGSARYRRSSRSPAKASAKVETWSGSKMRPSLVHPQIARSVAKGASTKNMASFRPKPVDINTANSLKMGVVNMGTVVNAPDRLMDKLDAMDAEKLAQLYDFNPRVFESYYSYHGIEYDPEYGNKVSSDKHEDVKLLISEYEKMFGRIE